MHIQSQQLQKVRPVSAQYADVGRVKRREVHIMPCKVQHHRHWLYQLFENTQVEPA